MRKLKVLISAYACEPDKGSEPGVGWNWAKQIARFHDVWVMTRANNRASIDKELRKTPDPNLHFIYYDVPKWLRFWKKKAKGLYLYYLLWQIGAYFRAREAHTRERFDLSHHVTFGNLWLPTFMNFLPIPFIWGPIGGGDQIPKAFRRSYPAKARLQELIRDFILATLKVNPFFLIACNKARLILVRTKSTLERIPQPFRYKSVRMMETGVPEGFMTIVHGHQERDELQVLCVGRLIYLKGFDLALKAFARVSNAIDGSRMLIIGDGPDRGRLTTICEEENIASKVSFTGHLDHKEVLRRMSESSIFLFPSLKEAGAWVVFEAMLSGLPIICLDVAGTAEIVTDETGIRIHLTTPEQTIGDLSAALRTLLGNAELRERMGEMARSYVGEHHNWEKKGEILELMYRDVLGA